MRLPARIKEALDATGRPWEVVNGGRHFKIRLEDRLVGILPHGRSNTGGPNAERNVVAQIRRATR